MTECFKTEVKFVAILLSSWVLALQSGGAGKDWVTELAEAAGRT